MISYGVKQCPSCGGVLYGYDHVNRIVRMKYGKITWTSIKRFKCHSCGQCHRELPDEIFPYKHYDAEIIQGVIDGLITFETLGFEDYPSEMTMLRWKENLA